MFAQRQRALCSLENANRLGEYRGFVEKCRGWDLNPRTPTGQAPEACAFNQAWLPLRMFMFFILLKRFKSYSLFILSLRCLVFAYAWFAFESW